MFKPIETISQRFSPKLLKVAVNTSWLFADRILRMGVGLVVGVWVARYLGPEQFGLYNYAIAFASLFDIVANLGLNSIVVRNIVCTPTCKNEILGTAFTLKLFAQTAALLLAIVIIFLLRPNNSLTHWLVGIIAAGMIFEAFDVIDFWFQSQVQSKYTVLAKNVGLWLTSIGRIILINMKASLIMFAWLWSAEIALGAVGLVIAYRFKGHLFQAWRFSLSYAKALLQDSWPLIFSSVMVIIYMRIDQIMLGQMLGDRAVGIYSVAVKISELWYFVPAAIANSFFPSIVESKQSSEKIYYNQIQNLFYLLSALAYVVAISVTCQSTQIVKLLYGNGYIDASSVLIIHVWTGLFASLGLVRGLWTITEGLMKYAFISSAIGASINVILNFFLISKYEILGAAISTVIAQIFAAYIANLLFTKTRKIFVMQTKAITMPFQMLNLFNLKRS
jgi:PST family polysaccharide transporter